MRGQNFHDTIVTLFVHRGMSGTKNAKFLTRYVSNIHSITAQGNDGGKRLTDELKRWDLFHSKGRGWDLLCTGRKNIAL